MLISGVVVAKLSAMEVDGVSSVAVAGDDEPLSLNPLPVPFGDGNEILLPNPLPAARAEDGREQITPENCDAVNALASGGRVLRAKRTMAIAFRGDANGDRDRSMTANMTKILILLFLPVFRLRRADVLLMYAFDRLRGWGLPPTADRVVSQLATAPATACFAELAIICQRYTYTNRLELSN